MVRFGPFTFDPESGDLARDGSVERIPPQSAHVLRVLLEKPGAVVSRAELKERIWPDTTVEFDQGLSFCIRQLRVALGDDATNPRYIETLPKRGYRFIAAVTNGEPPPPIENPVAIAGRPRSRAGWFVGAAAIAALAVAVAVSAAARPKPIPIAVVPFDADSSQLDYRDRLAEVIVERLTNTTAATTSVMGPSATRGFMSRTLVDSIRAKTGAAYALSGVVRPRGAGVEVFAQLIRAEDRGHIWVARWIDSSDAGYGMLGARISDSVITRIAARRSDRPLPRAAPERSSP